MQNHLKSVLKTFLLSCLMTIAIPTLAGEPSQSLININNASVEQLSELKASARPRLKPLSPIAKHTENSLLSRS